MTEFSRPAANCALRTVIERTNGRVVSAELLGNEVDVAGITHDSRDVRPGDIYVAVPGFTRHGAEFIDEVKQAGAIAVLSDTRGCEVAQAQGLIAIEVDDVRHAMALAAQAVYGNPDADLVKIAVTGTNGKTTTASMIRAILTAQGKAVGMIGTLGTFVGDVRLDTKRTTPEATDFYATLRTMVNHNIDVVVMEVSSHALSLGRVDGTVFDFALFTNLTQDHLDFHGTIESYFAAKAQLFTPAHSAAGLVCIDDTWGQLLTETSAVDVQSISASSPADWTIDSVVGEVNGHTSFVLNHGGQSTALQVSMVGQYNAMNAAMAIAACRMVYGISVEGNLALQTLPQVPGRLEIVSHHNNVLSVVDYAHTPDAVEKVLTELRRVANGKLFAVLGCGGDRDPVKRPLMGDIASQLADVVIVTDDNPRSEVPAEIREQVLAGIHGSADVQNIGDRTQAIATALNLAEPGDVVAVLGKGHETGQEINGVVHPFDDREVIRQVIARD